MEKINKGERRKRKDVRQVTFLQALFLFVCWDLNMRKLRMHRLIVRVVNFRREAGFHCTVIVYTIYTNHCSISALCSIIASIILSLSSTGSTSPSQKSIYD